MALYSIDTRELRKLRSELCDVREMREDAGDAFTQTMSSLGVLASKEAPRKTGKLARNTGWRSFSPLDGELMTDVGAVPYAVPVMFGAKAHEVSPVKAKALRIALPGGAVFAMNAKIPARAADPYLERTWAKHGDDAVQKIEKDLAKSLEKRL